MNQKLMLLTIAGVQEFISKARKTVDFYNSSHIVMDYLRKINCSMKRNDLLKNLEIVLPAKITEDNSDIPNYFISQFEAEGTNDKLENQIRDNLKKEFSQERKYMELDVYIVVVDYNGSYEGAYKELYDKLSAYKNDRFRNYSLVNSEQEDDNVEILNCSICGKNKGKYISRNNEFIKNKGPYIELSEPKISKEEVICENCFKKRKYVEENNIKTYPSTIDIPVTEWVEKVKENDRDGKLETYKSKIKEKYKNECISKYYHLDIVSKTGDEELIEDLKELNRLADGSDASRYYALIRADIDDLGKHFSGEYFNKNSDLKDFQQNLSEKILSFADKVKKEIESISDESLGIYLGGDDLLLFCPLYRVFEMIKYIDKEAGDIELEQYNQQITLSKAIVIIHDSIPLKNVINLSRSSLEKAKLKYRKEEKNALAISIINSSFTIRTAYLKNKDENIRAIEKLINGFKEYISASLISHLEGQISLLGEKMSFEEYEILMNVISNEIKRIASRKIKEDNRGSGDYISEIINLVLEFVNRNSAEYHLDLNGYFNLLHIVDKLSREIITLEMRESK